MTNITPGSIRGREAKEVVTDVLRERKVPRGLYSFKKGALHLLIGSRVFQLPVPAGMTFYGLQAAVRKLNDAIDDLEASRRHKNQIDLEDMIASAP